MCDGPCTLANQQEIISKATLCYCYVLFLGMLLVSISACRHNPADSGKHFPVKPGPILFISDNSGTKQLYSMNEDGSNVQQLTKNPNFPILDAKWSPDSKQIAYTRLMVPEAVDNNDIFIIDVNGTNEKRITRNTGISEGRVDWFQDGKSFLADVIDWTNTRSTVDIFSRNGKLQKQITPDSLTSYDALWSPDQKHIVYTSWGGIRQELFISDGDGNGAKVLPTTNRTFNNAVAWSGDSKKILFNATDSPGSSWGIFLINEDGSNLAEITPTNITNTLAVSWKRR